MGAHGEGRVLGAATVGTRGTSVQSRREGRGHGVASGGRRVRGEDERLRVSLGL